jgi:NADPH2:quinone reductase
MKAYAVGDNGPELVERPIPAPGKDDVLVRVRACALNRADLAMARGVKHGAAGGAGAVLGLEWAGEVAEVGANVAHLKPGDRVMGSGAEAFAEYALSDQGRVLPIPRADASFEQAACLPVALQTMHDAVVTHGELKAGQSILIQGASSGVGLMGLQIARLMGAVLVVGSSTNAERRARLAEFGAHLAIDTGSEDWIRIVRDATQGRGVDVVVDQVTGKLASQTLHATRVLGRIVNVGRLGGNQAEFDFDIHARRRITLVGVTFRTRSKEEVREISKRMQADLGPALAAGKLSLPISHTFAFDALPEALGLMAANRHFGKIVLKL